MIRHVGDTEEIECLVTHPKTGLKVKPNTFVLKVKRPNLEEDTITCTEPETGVFEGTYEYTEAGPYVYSAKPSAPYKASTPEAVVVKGVWDV